MTATRGILYPVQGVPDASASYVSLFSGLPLDVIARIGEDGLTGMVGLFEDFMVWNGPVAEGAASGWLLSGPTGAATITLPDDRKGVAALTTDATASAVATLAAAGALTAENFVFSASKRMTVAARFKLQTVASMEFFFGLGTGDSSPTTTGTFPSDGIFFEKAASATGLDFHVRKDGTSTEKTAIGITLADDTYATIGFTSMANGVICPFYTTGASLAPTAALAKAVSATDANAPGSGDPMQLMIGHLGASLVTTIDWLLAMQER